MIAYLKFGLLGLSVLSGVANAQSSFDSAGLPSITCPKGVYLLDGSTDGDQGVAIPEVFTEHRKISNVFGAMLTGGMSGLKIKTVLLGRTAQVRTKSMRPVFRFCFDVPDAVVAEASSSGGSDYVGASKKADSPREYLLVRFEGTDKNREVAVAKSRIGGISGALTDSMIRFTQVEKQAGIFFISPNEDLEPGEYGFIHSVGSVTTPVGKGQKPVEQVFDFTVEPKSSAEK